MSSRRLLLRRSCRQGRRGLASLAEALNVYITELGPTEASPREPPRALEGWRLAVKDCFSTSGVRTTCGSRMLCDYVPPFTATVVQRLQDAGCVVTGKTNQDEFSMGSSSTGGAFGSVLNPWGLADAPKGDFRVAGGSSGGSAVAVATGLARIALGSDTGGSVRNPAAWCGVLGLKPTYGALSRHGLIPLVNSLDVPGLFAANAQDARKALSVMMGIDPRDSTSMNPPPQYDSTTPLDVTQLRIGVPREYRTSELSSDVLNCWESTLELLTSKGAKVSQVSLPHTSTSISCYHVLGECDVASNMARFDGIQFGLRAPGDNWASSDELYAASRQLGFGEVVRRRILAGNFFLLRENYERYVKKAMRVRRLIADDFRRVFESVDVLVTPVASSTAPLFSAFHGSDDGYSRERADDFFTQPANMAGIPALSVPLGLSSEGLPLALQLMGPHWAEQHLLSTAEWLMERTATAKLDVAVLERALSETDT